LNDLRRHLSVKSSFSFGEAFHITVENGFAFDELKVFLESEGHTDIEIQSIMPSVEDCFMALSKKCEMGTLKNN
jgi:hypothetical protein